MVNRDEINRKSYELIKNFLYINTKENGKQQFIPNEPQLKLYREIRRQEKEGRPVRIIIEKARQMGFTTATGGKIFANTILNTHSHSCIVSQIDSTATNIFTMYKNYYDWMPKAMQPDVRTSNAKELIFDNRQRTGLDSKISVLSASDDVGRGNTFQYVHISEFAFWQCDKKKAYASLMSAVPNTPNSLVIIESTANGFEEFKEMWDDAVLGKNEYTPLFFAWFEMSSYRMRVPEHFEFSKLELEMKEKYNLDDEQVYWWHWTFINTCFGDINLMHQEFPSCPEEAFIASGNSYFDNNIVNERLQRVGEPVRIGDFEYDYDDTKDIGKKISNIRFVENKYGNIKIYKDVIYYKDEEGRTHIRPYVIGGDTAGEGSDDFVGQVIDNISGEQVAVLKHTFDEDLYARQMYCLGMYYNTALLGIETNFSTFPQKELQRLGYPHTKFYRREVQDTFSGQLQEKFGFRTTTITRPLILGRLQSIVRETPELINDRETLNEMMVFVKNEKGKPEAMQGKHDDLIMGIAIAYEIRQQQSFDEEIIEVVKKKFDIEEYERRRRENDFGKNERRFMQW